MKKVGVIVPIHPKHYFYAYELIEKITKNDITLHLFLVFSSNKDYELFQKKDFVSHIILPADITTGNIVNYKKFYALETLQENKDFEYFIVCDAEIDLIQDNCTECNILRKVVQVFENKVIYGGKTNDEYVSMILHASAQWFEDKSGSFEKLRELTDDFHIYYWFSDLPVYKRDHLKTFFKIVSYKDSFMDFYSFDHLMYINYLILFHDFKLCNVTNLINHYWSLECYIPKEKENLETLKNQGYGFSWVSKTFFDKYEDYLRKEGAFMIYHLDRQ